MRILIDIPEEAYKTIMNTSFVRDADLTFKQSAKDIEQTNAIFSLIDALDNGTPIPDNATNADVIRTLFPDGIPKDIVWTLQGDKGANWWNAPYQKGGKE